MEIGCIINNCLETVVMMLSCLNLFAFTSIRFVSSDVKVQILTARSECKQIGVVSSLVESSGNGLHDRLKS